MCVCVCVCVCVHTHVHIREWVKVAQSCPSLWDPIDYTVHRILQARILEWVAFPFSRGSSPPRDWIQVSCIAGGFFASWATREAQEYWSGYLIPSPVDLPNPGIKLGSPTLQADSLPTELSGKPYIGMASIHHFIQMPQMQIQNYTLFICQARLFLEI